MLAEGWLSLARVLPVRLLAFLGVRKYRLVNRLGDFHETAIVGLSFAKVHHHMAAHKTQSVWIVATFPTVYAKVADVFS